MQISKLTNLDCRTFGRQAGLIYLFTEMEPILDGKWEKKKRLSSKQLSDPSRVTDENQKHVLRKGFFLEKGRACLQFNGSFTGIVVFKALTLKV